MALFSYCPQIFRALQSLSDKCGDFASADGRADTLFGVIDAIDKSGASGFTYRIKTDSPCRPISYAVW